MGDELVFALTPPATVTNVGALWNLGASSISGKDSTLRENLSPSAIGEAATWLAAKTAE